MADTIQTPEERAISPPTHALVEVKHPNAGLVLSQDGKSANLTRSTRVVSDRVVFVDNIPDSFTKEELCEIVSEYACRGPIVDVKFLTRTKGSSFAFVEFENEEDGREAISGLNTKDYTASNGKVLELRASKAENPTETVSNKNLYVKGLPKTWSNDDLKRRFRGYGSISHCRTLKRPGTSNENTGVGFVHFFNALDAAKAIEEVDESLADPNDPESNYLEVKFARAKKRGGRNRKQRGGRGGGNDYARQVPNWNFGGRGRGNMRGNGRGMRGRGGFQGMYPPDGNNNPEPMNPEVWAKMVEIMQNMSMWQNPYNVYGTSSYPNYYPRNNSNNNGPGDNNNNNGGF